MSAGRDVAEVYAASVGAQHFNTSAKLNKEDQNKSKHTKPNLDESNQGLANNTVHNQTQSESKQTNQTKITNKQRLEPNTSTPPLPLRYASMGYMYFFRISFRGIYSYFYKALKFFSIDCTVVRFKKMQVYVKGKGTMG